MTILVVGYQLQAVIASADHLRRLTADQIGMHVVELNQDFALMPMTAELHDRVVVLGGQRYGFWFFPDGFGDTLAAWSAGAGGVRRGGVLRRHRNARRCGVG